MFRSLAGTLTGPLHAQNAPFLTEVSGRYPDPWQAPDEAGWPSTQGRESRSHAEVGLQELGLPENSDIPVLAFIGRLDEQKGVDLIRESFDWLMGEGVQLVLLGSGRADLENSLRCRGPPAPSLCLTATELMHDLRALHPRSPSTCNLISIMIACVTCAPKDLRSHLWWRMWFSVPFPQLGIPVTEISAREH